MTSKNHDDINLKGFEYIWTTHIQEIILVENKENGSYGIVRVFPSGTISSIIIEDNDIYRALQKKLLEADAKIMTYSAFMEYKFNRS